MKVTWHGHAFFELETHQGIRIAIDPFTGNPLTRVKPRDLHPDLVLVTHGHYDHLGCAAELDAPVVCNYEIATWLERRGRKALAMNVGGTLRFRDLRIWMAPALHSGGLPDDAAPMLGNGGSAYGFVVDDGRTKVYHAGDTGLFGDMKHVIGDVVKPDVALLPIGDLFTMGPEHAAIAVKWLGVKAAIPMHYNTYPPITVDPDVFVRGVGSAAKVHVLSPDSSVTL